VIKDHLIMVAGAAAEIAATVVTEAIVVTATIVEIAAIVVMVAAEVFTPDRVLVHFVTTNHRKSITKTMICCAATCTKTAKSALVAKQVTVPSTSVNWLWQSSVLVTWRYCLLLAKFYANLTW
jgi:hypothetical protein